MSAKGQKFKSYDIKIKQNVIKDYHSGKSITYLCNNYKIPEGTAADWILKKV